MEKKVQKSQERSNGHYCSKCHNKIESLPFICKFCKKVHCHRHMLPEVHNCKELEIYKEKKRNEWKERFSRKELYNVAEEEKPESHKIFKRNFLDRIKEWFN